MVVGYGSIDENERISQNDDRLKKHFSLTETFHKLKAVYSLPLFAPA